MPKTVSAPAARRTRSTAPAPKAPARARVRRAEPADDMELQSLLPPDKPRVASARQMDIYRQASRLFVSKGYDATSMSDIAKAVNITKAGLYHFVKGKEDLLFTIKTFGMDELFDEVVYPAREEADPLARLKLIIRNHLQNIARVSSKQGNPVTIVADDPTGLSPKFQKIIDARKREYFNLVRGTLEELRARGDVADELDLTIATHNIIGMILWMARWRKPKGRLSVDDIIDQITRMALTGVMAR